MTPLRALSLLLLAALGLVWADDKPRLKDDYGSELPRIAPREPAEALKTFRLLSGFQMELVATEPLIRSPVAFDFDEDGRLYVAEYPEYNQYANPAFKGHGSIKRLEDTDGDGRYDKATVYVSDLDSPVAVACWDGGVFVGVVPNILYCKDTDGDGRADHRIPIFTGFARDAAGEAMMNSFRWGFDNRFHLSTNLAGGQVRLSRDEKARPINVKGLGFHFDPRSVTSTTSPASGPGFELTSGGGQHGMSRDDWGRTFVCDNSNPIHTLMYDARYLLRHPYVQAPAAAVDIAPEGKYTRLFRISPNEPWRILRTRLRSQGLVAGSDEGGQPSGFFTGATGITVYRGDAWPEQYRGNLFVGEVSGNLVYRARLESRGLGLIARRADEGREFLASSDNWFRPVQFANAPDGTLHVLDMYRELIEGAAFLPPQILKHLDVSSGIDRGRIWRIVHESERVRGRRPLPMLSKATTMDLVKLLEHANGWHRDTASRLLYQRQDRQAIPHLDQLAMKSSSPLGRMHALHSLHGLGALNNELLLKALSDSEPRVREQALRLAERVEASPAIRARIDQMTEDPDARVRYQVAFTLGFFPGEAMPRALARLAQRESADPWMRLAVLSSTAERGGDVFSLLSGDATYRATVHGRVLLTALAVQIGAANKPNEVAQVVKAINDLPGEEKALTQELVKNLVSKQPAGGRERLAGVGGGKASAVLSDLLQQARKSAADVSLPPDARAAALRTLGLAPYAEARDLFAHGLALRQPQPVQAAVLETLVRYEDSSIPDLILSSWPGFSPQLRATAAETLFARAAWVHSFLDAVERGTVKPADIDPARVQLLQASADARIRTRATALFATTRLSRREDVVKAYQKALTLPGDATRGKAAFKKECSACHRLEGVGESLGADLSAIRDRGLEAVLLNILDPNREVKPQFLSYVVELQNGRTLTGMIATETANGVTLRRADGTTEAVLRVNIAEMRSTGLSFMPEGLEKQLDLQGMADLLSYLNSIK